ncbi:prolipoprotein diacylglyceryl transferase, partial [bacterium]|nr:prolipoprotein diacylglyceryl transferase [bacterium]
MHPTFINLFGIQITWYGVMVALAFVVMWFSAVFRGKKLGYSEDFIQNLLTIIVISAFVFARLLHVVVDWDMYAADPSKILLSRDGYVFLGGFVGAVCVSIWYIRRNNQSIFGIADLFAPFLALAHGIGRIGCFLFGCCYGKVCSAAYGLQFPEDSPAYIDHFNHGLIDSSASHSLPVYPTQLYHSLFNFLNFGILLFILSRQKFKGQIAMGYLMIYSTGRFIVEFYRGDYRGAIGILSTSQIIAITLFAGGLIGYI